jgi:hypothetical protein
MDREGTGANLLAAGLELVPLTAPMLFFFAFVSGFDELFFGVLALAVASGIGWWRLGFTRQALLLVALRGFVLLGLLGWGLMEQISTDINEHYSPNEAEANSRGTYLLVLAATFFLVSTVASSAAAFAVSRRTADIS